MTTYDDAGVNIAKGDEASSSAYAHAVATFPSRKGMIGEPVFEEGGYAGFLDMGTHYLVQSDDSTGTKIDLAFAMQKFDTLGYDLVAMVADDAVCTGAESISISNTLDMPRIDPEVVEDLMRGLSRACSEQHIVIPAGEIAEVPGAVTHGVWSATVVGIVEKNKVLQPERIEPGDVIIALRSAVARSNGFSLIRKILTDSLGDQWFTQRWKDSQTWGEIMLTPSVIYSAALLTLLGRYDHDRTVHVKGLAHITGGGIPSKLRRILKKSGLGAQLTNLWPPHEAMSDLIDLGSVPLEEAYHTWNMGNGMLVIVPPKEADKAVILLKEQGIGAQKAGVVTDEHDIVLDAYTGEKLTFNSR
ncbi:MAG: phosphoribosylformylglycinamidine cyclo-ligase [Candidatus Peribacteraceae bacterium]